MDCRINSWLVWEFSITNSSMKSRAKEHTWFARSRRFWLIRTCWRWRSVEAVRTNPSSSNGPSLSLVEIFLYLSKLPNNKSHNSSENVALKAFWAFDHSAIHLNKLKYYCFCLESTFHYRFPQSNLISLGHVHHTLTVPSNDEGGLQKGKGEDYNRALLWEESGNNFGSQDKPLSANSCSSTSHSLHPHMVTKFLMGIP